MKTLARCIENSHEAVGVGCKSWYCEKCSQAKGLELRERLIPIVATFKRAFMLTLTVDPKQFDNPQQAHSYLTQRRCVSRLIRELRKRNYLNDDRYFAVKEFQKDTQMTHYHVLVDADFVPIRAVREIWGRFVPEWYERPENDASPYFGSVFFSAPKFENAKHAACYVTKYLIKPPMDGYPDWVLHSKSRVTRYTTSRGFWGEKPEEDPPADPLPCEPKIHEGPLPCPDVCFCERCRGEEPFEVEKATTIAERVEECCKETVILIREEWMQTDGEIVTVFKYHGRLPYEPRTIALYAGVESNGKKSFPISQSVVEELLGDDATPYGDHGMSGRSPPLRE